MKKQHYFDLLRLWMRNYFKHPVENIRQAKPIVPGRLYRNFGNICKAVPMTASELRYVKECEGYEALSPYLLKDLDKSGNGLSSLRELQQKGAEDAVPVRCNLCDFYKYGIPCPVHNVLADGSTVCDTHRYIIIKHISYVK